VAFCASPIRFDFAALAKLTIEFTVPAFPKPGIRRFCAIIAITASMSAISLKARPALPTP